MIHGLSVYPQSGGTWRQEVAFQESHIGAKVRMLRRYVVQSRRENIASPDSAWAISAGYHLAVTFKASGTWASIAAGAQDAWLHAQAAAVAAMAPQPDVLSFNHEADSKANLNRGSAADYVAAYRHVFRIFAAEGVTSERCYNPTGYLAVRAAAYYPGDGWVDILGVDEPYCWYPVKPDLTTGGTWVSPAKALAEARKWTDSVGKPVMIGEWGCQADPRKAAWIKAAGDYFRSWPQLRSATYFSVFIPGQTPNWRLDTSAGALAAFAALVAQ